MASWQFDLYLIPKERLVALVGTYPIAISRELFENTAWWEGGAAPNVLEADLASFLPGTKSWSSDIAVWGEENGNRIDVLYEGDEIIEIFVRIDLRQRDRRFVVDLIRFAKNHETVLLTTNMRVLEPTLNNLIKAMEESDAHLFVNDLKGFWESLDPE